MNPNTSATWYEIWFSRPAAESGKRFDGRRRSKATAERVAAELRATRNYYSVWLVEVNRLKKGLV